MKKLLIALALAATTAAALAETMMKPGLWEVRMLKQVVDGRDMTAQMAAAQAQMQKALAGMSPQQRKQMEAVMGRQAAPAAGAQQVCISPEMAARDKPLMPADARCEPAKMSRSGNKVSFEFNCASAGRTTAGKGESILSGDSVSTRMDMTTTDAHGRHTMQSESQMKYLGADCRGLKPADQIVREMQAARKK
ncbi:MAG: hypothetical protein CVU17_03095 [Betaproteobacteria bacterium HGW-Betaproteobacteria-11]|nr:MAG: hypothetical protein CVU17_03095 [Betaproteobacteria bacterium HGW-Betaproteobacteria-11]